MNSSNVALGQGVSKGHKLKVAHWHKTYEFLITSVAYNGSSNTLPWIYCFANNFCRNYLNIPRALKLGGAGHCPHLFARNNVFHFFDTVQEEVAIKDCFLFFHVPKALKVVL